MKDFFCLTAFTLQTNVSVMIVTIQAVFCVVKELLQSLLSYCHEDYSEGTYNGYDAIEIPIENRGMLNILMYLVQ